MAKLKIYLDARAVPEGRPAPLKLSITHKGRTALLSLGVAVMPSQWDMKNGKVCQHKNKAAINSYIENRVAEAEAALMRLVVNGECESLSVMQIRDKIKSALDGRPERRESFVDCLLSFAKNKKEGTRGLYMQTLRRMEAYDAGIRDKGFEDITREWLQGFDRFMERTSPSKNARNIHLRNIRAVFNDAIDDDKTTAYPFRKFKIRPVPTAKRSLTVEQLRTLFDYPVEEYQRRHLDMFKLTFYLIGINTVDLYNLERITADGRVEYVRAKTGREYSIKVEPEAMEIIERYRGKKKLLDIADTYNNHVDWRKRMNTALQRIGEVEIGKHGKKSVSPIFPEITTYWARHTWATLAAELEIPKETIAAALGHGGNTVTDIYINFNNRKIDEANRKVIDFVSNKKREG